MLLKRSVLEEHFSSQKVSVEVIGDDAIVLIDTEASGTKRYGSRWNLSKDKSYCEQVYLENGEREVLSVDNAPSRHLKIIKLIAEKMGFKTPDTSSIE